MVEHAQQPSKDRLLAMRLARKLAWWASYINRTHPNEDAVADAGNDAAFAYSVLRSIGTSEEDIAKLSSATY